MSKFLLSEYKEQLKEKYGYTEDLAQDLAIMTESLVDEYGETYQSVICDAVLSCKYSVAGLRKGSNIYENTYDVLEREGMVSKDMNKESLKSAESAFVSKPEISYREGIYHIDSVSRLVVLPRTFNSSSSVSLAILARETNNLVKSHLKGHEIEGDQLISRRGLSEETSKLSITSTGEVEIKPESSIGAGLEEALTSYDELRIIRDSYDSEYDTQSYSAGRVVAGFIEDNLGLRDIIREAQVTKNYDTLRTAIDTHMEVGYDEFLSRMDELQKLDKQKYFNSLNVSSKDEIDKNIQEYFSSSIAPIVGGMQASIKRDEFESSLGQN